MKTFAPTLAAFLVSTAICGAIQAPDAFTKACAAAAAGAETATVAGDVEGWLFVRNELAQLGQGAFWESFDGRDPVKVIGEYQKALAALGVDLVVAPVPAKAALYPEKFSATAGPASVTLMTPLLKKIAETGAKVIDLELLYRAHLAEGQIYCAQDAHWTPLGAKLAAQAVADELPEIVAAGQGGFVAGNPGRIEIKGDQAKDEFAGLPKEEVVTYPVSPPAGDGPAGAVLVIGDSHLQVFTDGGAQFHCTGSGFLDHLQLALKQPVASVKNSGDGVDAPRVRIAKAAAKDPDYWAGKKAVVWVFSSRAFTSAIQKWRAVPAKP